MDKITLDKKYEEIPAYKICINSKIPEGRNWCDFYNQPLAGRCNKDCIGYDFKELENKAKKVNYKFNSI